MDMTAEIEITRAKEEPGATTLAVTAPVEVVKAVEKRAAVQFAQRARLPGFRKGKVPTDVIRRRFGDAIRETVIREIVSDSWKLALDTEKLEPIAEPQVHSLTFNADEPLTFEFLVEVKPELAIERVGGFTITRKQAPVQDADVDEQVERLRADRAPWIPIEERPKAGDLGRVTIVTGDADAEDAKPYDIVLGAGQALAEVEEKVMTLTPGETVDTTITFPPDFPDESKRGQTVATKLSLLEAKRQELPELTDEFASEVGDFATMKALREAIREDLEKAAVRDADADVRRQLLELVTGANNVPAPRPMVDRMMRAYAEMYQVGEEQWEKFATEFTPIVEGQVKRELVIDHLATTNDLKATEDDIDTRVEEIAKRSDTDPGRVYAALQKENRLKELERTLTEEKLFDYLLSQSTINDE